MTSAIHATTILIAVGHEPIVPVLHACFQLILQSCESRTCILAASAVVLCSCAGRHASGLHAQPWETADISHGVVLQGSYVTYHAPGRRLCHW